jgi:pilus assembly protein Flp/PilA
LLKPCQAKFEAEIVSAIPIEGYIFLNMFKSVDAYAYSTGTAMTSNLRQYFSRFLRDESGPTAVEYAVMIALIVGVCVGTVQTLAVATRENFDASSQAIEDAIN